jgi:hypothetical protein
MIGIVVNVEGLESIKGRRKMKVLWDWIVSVYWNEEK